MVEGEMLKLSADQLLVRQEDGIETSLTLSDNSVYWEGIEWLTVFPVEIKDQIIAYGEWSKDRSGFMVE